MRSVWMAGLVLAVATTTAVQPAKADEVDDLMARCKDAKINIPKATIKALVNTGDPDDFQAANPQRRFPRSRVGMIVLGADAHRLGLFDRVEVFLLHDRETAWVRYVRPASALWVPYGAKMGDKKVRVIKPEQDRAGYKFAVPKDEKGYLLLVN